MKSAFAGATLAVVLAALIVAFAAIGTTSTTSATDTTSTAGTSVATGTAAGTGTAAATGTAGVTQTPPVTETAGVTETPGVTQTPPVTRTPSVTQTPPVTPSPTNTPPAGAEGCTPGYWKVRPHLDSWPPTGFSTGQTLGSVFTIPAEFSALSSVTLLQALSLDGGEEDIDAAALLLHHAVAALLNSAHPDVDYAFTTAQVIADTNAALASSDRDTMLSQKDEFDDANNETCPLD